MTTRISTGTRMKRGGSWGIFVKPLGSPLKNTSWMNRRLYATLNMAAMTAPAGSSHSIAVALRLAIATPKNISLLRKPLSSGTPAIAPAATIASAPVHGMYFHKPLSLRMSREPVSWSMMPAAMNREALKVAWLRMWNTPATTPSGSSSPNSSVISPRWLIVE